jgi:hypothetical protein
MPYLLLFLLSSTFAAAQSFYVGPTASYVVSTSVPEEVQQSGAPTRMTFGAMAIIAKRSSMEFRFDLNYRIENGAFTTNYNALPSTLSPLHPRLSVVDPTPQPQISSTLNTSSIEASAMMLIPVGDLDTSGSKFFLELGVLADRVLTAQQTDDYSNIPNYSGPQTVTVDYEGQFGFGAMIGAGLSLQVGGDRILFDMRYVFRQPTTLTTTTTPPQDQNVAWLIGRGLRIGLSYAFGF